MSECLASPIRLTESVQKGGCAAKLPAGELKRILENLKPHRPPELALGSETLDDAALWDLGGDQYLVQTLDFFTPMIDDPESFGEVAAANALSDVYAMGGQPKTALTILAFPTKTLDLSVLALIMRGAVRKIEEAGACLAGGHSIDDDTLKLGFSVSGFVSKNRTWKNSGAKAGDRLILTKALGTGTLCSAVKNKSAKPEWITGLVESMTRLNRVPELLGDVTVHAATDITGFGLAAHAMQMGRASSVDIEFEFDKLPVLPGAARCLSEKILNRAHRTNEEYAREAVTFASHLSDSDRWLAFDPQTSGGLLLSVSLENYERVMACLSTRFPSAAVVGTVKSVRSGLPQVSFL